MSYVEVAKLKKVVDMRTAATRKCSKVQPRALNGEIFMAKKLQITAWANAFQRNTKNGVCVVNSSTANIKKALLLVST